MSHTNHVEEVCLCLQCTVTAKIADLKSVTDSLWTSEKAHISNLEGSGAGEEAPMGQKVGNTSLATWGNTYVEFLTFWLKT